MRENGSRRRPWLRILGELSPRRRAGLTLASFLGPLALWSVVSYVPFVWHPMIRVLDAGDAAWFSTGELVEREAFADENARIHGEGGHLATGVRANPVFLPPPHAVLRAMVTGFTTPPARPEEPWLHQALWHSITVIFWGFLVSSLLGVPLGILCGALPSVARLTEPFVEFFRYLPAPAFGALAVAVLGIHDAPKVAIIFVGTFFQQVLVIANTTRRIDPALLEAAQTLGASRRALLYRVIVPGITTRVSRVRREAPSVSAASSSAGSIRRVVLAMTSTCWKKVPMKMIDTLGASSMPSTATASAPNAGAGR